MLKYIIPTFIIYNVIYLLYYKNKNKNKKRIRWCNPIKKEYYINYNNSISEMFEK